MIWQKHLLFGRFGITLDPDMAKYVDVVCSEKESVRIKFIIKMGYYGYIYRASDEWGRITGFSDKYSCRILMCAQHKYRLWLFTLISWPCHFICLFTFTSSLVLIKGIQLSLISSSTQAYFLILAHLFTATGSNRQHFRTGSC